MGTLEEEKKKREIFEAMSPKRQARILQKGYEKWDPFQKPKEPLEKIQGMVGEQTRALKVAQQFFTEKNLSNPSNDFAQGVIEVCQGLLQKDERCQGILEFCLWYQEKRERED